MLIISDFSKTFTNADMPTSWSVIAKSGLLGDAYIFEREALYLENIHYEKEGNIEMTEKWFFDHAALFAKYHLTQDMIDQVVMDDAYFAPRDGVREFLDYITEQGIPLVIVTSGVSNFVITWFQKRWNFVPEIVFGTELIVSKEGVVVGIEPDSVISPLDKKVYIESEDNTDDVIVIGDNTEDLGVTVFPKLSIGFTDEEKGFDVKLGKEGSMKGIMEYLK